MDVINELIGQKADFLPALRENIRTVISETNNKAVAKINRKLEELQ